jgi:hypothetical protein
MLSYLHYVTSFSLKSLRKRGYHHIRFCLRELLLQDLLRDRTIADYHAISVSTKKADRVLRLSQTFVNEIEARVKSD